MEHYDILLFRWINGHYASWLDWPMWIASQAWSWAIVIMAVAVCLLCKRQRQGLSLSPLWWLLTVGLALCFLFSDQISVHGFKDVFQRLRPCYALQDVRMFHTRCGGRYGFVSSHAANVFSVVLFLGFMWLREMKGRRRFLLPALLLLWALVVCYSRVYLGKHFPSDVVCGAAVGACVGAVVCWIISAIARRVSAKAAQ